MVPQTPEATPSAADQTSSPPLWPPSAQWGAVGLLVILGSLVAWHLYLASSWSSQPTTLQPDCRIDVNNASALQLEALPHIGPALAERIIVYRRENNGFTTIEELRNVPGIGTRTLAQIRERIFLEPRVQRAEDSRRAEETTPLPLNHLEEQPKDSVSSSYRVNVNRATHAELCRLPRIGPILAQRILDARLVRPFRSVEDLTRVHGIGAKTVQNLRPYVVVAEMSANR